MRERTAFKGEFFAFLVFAALAMNLMAGANDLILIALSIEFLSITSYILAGYLRDDEFSAEAGLKYFLYGSITSAAMLFGLSLLYGATATTSLPEIAKVVAAPETALVTGLDGLILPALLMVLAGIGFKIALVPFHQWSPDTYEGAPTPVTSFLSVGPKAAGFAMLLRLLMTALESPTLTPGWLGVLAGISLITMLFGNIVALSQTNVKRMMAYSSIAQAGYMLVGLASFGGANLLGLEPLGSVLLFILAYVFTNLGAFAVIIAVDHALGASHLSAYGGLMRRSPLLAVPLFIFMLSLVGIPPLAGFIGKFAVFGSAVAGGQTWLAVAGVLAGVISVGYYFQIAREMFFGSAPEDAGPVPVPPALAFVIVAALFMTFVIGLFPDPFIDLAGQAAETLGPLAEPLAEISAGR
jgi:proton-translocating NADH-quinone oxidoreductase chain N